MQCIFNVLYIYIYVNSVQMLKMVAIISFLISLFYDPLTQQ